MKDDVNMPACSPKINGTRPRTERSEPRQIGEVVDVDAFIITTAIRACAFHTRKAVQANDPEAQVRILRTIAGIVGRAVQFHEDQSGQSQSANHQEEEAEYA